MTVKKAMFASSLNQAINTVDTLKHKLEQLNRKYQNIQST